MWRLSSAAFLASVLLLAVYTAVRHYQLPEDSRKSIPLWNLVLGWSFATVSILLLASNVGATNWVEPAFAYTAAILLVLGIGATNFFTIAIQKLL